MKLKTTEVEIRIFLTILKQTIFKETLKKIEKKVVCETRGFKSDDQHKKILASNLKIIWDIKCQI